MSITNGGLVVTQGYAYIALLGASGTAGSSGAVTVDGAGSTWTIGGAGIPRLFVGGNNAEFQGGTALLSVTNGGAVIVNPGQVGLIGAFVGVSGTVTGNGSLTLQGAGQARLMNAKGTLAPTGTLTINGNLLLQSTATTLCNVTPQAADRVDVLGLGAGNVTLRGHLYVTMTGTFTPTVTRYTLLHAQTALTLTFDSVSINYKPGFFTPHITYDANNVYLDLDFTQ
jgi:T5SS/PEP-CTERM-associated repeat protein